MTLLIHPFQTCFPSVAQFEAILFGPAHQPPSNSNLEYHVYGVNVWMRDTLSPFSRMRPVVDVSNNFTDKDTVQIYLAISATPVVSLLGG
jgi:isocitrate/isopropylmalate dehydrogenase